ncbi:hypothetical protein REPUB_Repub07fG0058300 [Reevesia pubescens]
MEWSLFWVQIHGFSIGMMKEKICIVIGETVGDVEEVDGGDGKSVWGKFLRVRVNVNKTKPLKRGTRISTGDGKKSW